MAPSVLQHEIKSLSHRLMHLMLDKLIHFNSEDLLHFSDPDHQYSKSTLEPLIKNPLRKGQPPNKGHTSGPLSDKSSSLFLTSEKRMTSQQRTQWLVAKCPLHCKPLPCIMEDVHMNEKFSFLPSAPLIRTDCLVTVVIGGSKN